MTPRKSDAEKFLENKIKELNGRECHAFYVLHTNKDLEESIHQAMVEYARYVKDQETKRREQ